MLISTKVEACGSGVLPMYTLSLSALRFVRLVDYWESEDGAFLL